MAELVALECVAAAPFREEAYSQAHPSQDCLQFLEVALQGFRLASFPALIGDVKN